ncbi:RsmE family RNA methyltransferase [Chlamydiota bacterium]
MKLRRFYTSCRELCFGRRITLNCQETHHIRTVLRLRENDSIELFNSTGCVFTAIIENFLNDEVIVRVNEESPFLDEKETKKIYLLYAFSKGIKIELVLQKTTELGIDGIFLFGSTHSIAKFDEKMKRNRLERYHRIVLEACKQSRRVTVPDLHIYKDLDTVFKEQTDHDALCLIADINGGDIPDIRHDFKDKKTVMLVVGPEGGLTDEEKNLLEQQYLHYYISLGKNILRTETAAIAAVAVMKNIVNFNRCR